MANPERIVRDYIGALNDPSSLRDEEAIAAKGSELSQTDDVIARLRLQEELRQLTEPSLERIEDEFVIHGKAWADEQGITAASFGAEGVPATVLRRAGFTVGGGRAQPSRKRSGGSTRKSSGTRVTTEEVIAAMPNGAFTVKMLREVSGASPAVVRKAINAETEAGRLVDAGTDPDHVGPGRAPTLYRRP